MSKATFERILLWIAITFAVVMATLPKPPKIYLDQFGDKFEHMLAFSVIALLAAIAYPKVRLTRIAERLSFLGALIEIAQSVPALHRDCNIFDWVADTGAIIVVLTIVALVRWQRRPSLA
jgi:membrane protease YdiL (CAAX protease family)